VLDLFHSTLTSVWLTMAGVPDSLNSAVTVLQNTPWLVTPGEEADPDTEAIAQRYLKELANKGLLTNAQGVWLQAGPTLLASNQGTTPLPAASLTKVATSLVSLATWGPNHRFETLVSASGSIQQGTLYGDLVIQGGGDPLFVWEEAFALGNTLNRMGIKRVMGNLVIVGNFAMNFEVKPDKAGELLREALNSESWSEEASYQYQQLPAGTAKPKVAIAGMVQVVPGNGVVGNLTPLLRHYSLPLSQILKNMNIYSNNVMSQSLADLLGGHQVVAQKAAELSGAPVSEILLANGSGLGVENRISPRAVAMMFVAIQRYVEEHNLTIADLFPIAGRDHHGTIKDRKIPTASVVKTGTLNDVSALAGVLPTRDRGLIWFTIINRGTDLEDLRQQQDSLLQRLTTRWGTVQPTPAAIAPRQPLQTANSVSSENRNEILYQPAVEVGNPQ
jgi:D-alanyl-D-alanine carboxypeptidase/D-alanyl-D-alanine-endopeptidase (penicillin-binding protein 4)